MVGHIYGFKIRHGASNFGQTSNFDAVSQIFGVQLQIFDARRQYLTLGVKLLESTCSLLIADF